MESSLSPSRRTLLAAPLLALAAAACTYRKLDTPPATVVFFTAFSADLDPPARGVIAEFAKDAKTAPNRPIAVRGYADSIGTTQANRMLSALRTQVVTDALVAQGIDRSRITQRPRGPTNTDPGVESRRVELEIAS